MILFGEETLARKTAPASTERPPQTNPSSTSRKERSEIAVIGRPSKMWEIHIRQSRKWCSDMSACL
jgi:hypothetical protein